jgi:hypothetical protein
MRTHPPGPGETTYIFGQYDPCRSCFNRMAKQAAEGGGTIVYMWPGGPKEGITFHGSTPPPYPSHLGEGWEDWELDRDAYLSKK